MLIRVGYDMAFHFPEPTAVVLRNEAIVEDTGQPDPQVWDTPQHNVQDVADDVLRFLLASRYCEVDSELPELAWTLCGRTRSGWPRVQAIGVFVHQHRRFDYMVGRANRTALET